MMVSASDSSVFLRLLSAPGPTPDLAEKLHLFGQFVGRWEVNCTLYQPDGSRQTQTGEIHFAWVLDGRAIQDIWIAPACDDQLPFEEYGTTIRFYDATLDAWKVTWISPLNHRVATMTARLIGDEIVVAGVDTRFSPPRLFRWIFSYITATTFHWRNLMSEDGGHTWQAQEELDARRIP
jgi:hypothetical protein